MELELEARRSAGVEHCVSLSPLGVLPSWWRVGEVVFVIIGGQRHAGLIADRGVVWLNVPWSAVERVDSVRVTNRPEGGRSHPHRVLLPQSWGVV